MKVPVKKINITSLRSRKSMFSLGLIILIICGVVAGLYVSKHNSKDSGSDACVEVIRNVDELLSQNRFQAAKDAVEADNDRCDQSSKVANLDKELEADSKVKSVMKLRDQAVEAYVAGDKEKAKSLANQALTIRNTITAEESKLLLAQMPNFSFIINDILDIIEGVYTPKMNTQSVPQ